MHCFDIQWFNPIIYWLCTVQKNIESSQISIHIPTIYISSGLEWLGCIFTVYAYVCIPGKYIPKSKTNMGTLLKMIFIRLLES